MEAIQNQRDAKTKENEETEVKEEIERRSRRLVTFKRPDKLRKIRYKKSLNSPWVSALVTQVGPSTGTAQFKCMLRLENFDEISVDFSDKDMIWEYEKFSCDACGKIFDTKRGLQMHIKKSHTRIKDDRRVTFKESNEEKVNYVENSNNYEEKDIVKGMKIRF